jgi:hypothetical protein
MVSRLMIIYGVRAIFMGLAVYAASYFRARKVLGSMLILSGCIGLADGMVCKLVGKGQWDHSGLALLASLLGVIVLGAFDAKPKRQ